MQIIEVRKAMVVDSWREKGEGGENNGETSLGNTFSNFTRGKYTPQNPVYNNKHDQGGIHGDNLNSNRNFLGFRKMVLSLWTLKEDE